MGVSKRPWVWTGLITLAVILLLPLAQHVKGVFLLHQAEGRARDAGVWEVLPQTPLDHLMDLPLSSEEAFADLSENWVEAIGKRTLLTEFAFMQALSPETAKLHEKGEPLIPVKNPFSAGVKADWNDFDTACQKLDVLVLPTLSEAGTGLYLWSCLIDFGYPIEHQFVANLVIWHSIQNRPDEALQYLRELGGFARNNPGDFQHNYLAPAWELLYRQPVEASFLERLQEISLEVDPLEATIYHWRRDILVLMRSMNETPPAPTFGSSPFGFPDTHDNHWDLWKARGIWFWDVYFCLDERSAQMLDALVDELSLILALQSRKRPSTKLQDKSGRFLGYFEAHPFGLPSVDAAQAQRSATLHQMLLAATALERYRLAHDEYPSDLGKLTPAFLSERPFDYFAMQPLRYHRLAPDEFRLYSIGKDGVDDGGVSARFLEEPDIVWPRTAQAGNETP